ncbi:hypothetical protein LPJ66_009561 [Kickxella alabastrina]|uniref:Uncharacterized protein n=1 Tax=Kickxella alabastrina TaxID=61397 RepID=A0ACC1I4H3_9FUNG|nr:hypothetical protein LPJ66_009561 [Kickxella alabastrina]
MKVCITRQFYAMEAVKRFGMGMFPSYASRAPMLTERIVDYYIGGLSAMAAGTADCWHALVDWFGHGDFSRKCLVSDRHQPQPQPQPNRTRAFDGKSPAQALLDEMWPREQWMQSVGDSIAAADDSKPWIVSASSLRFPALPPKPAQNSKVNGTVRGNSHTNRQHAFAPKHQRLLSQDSRPAAFEACAELSTLFPLIKQLYSTSAYSGFGTAVATGDFSGSGHASVAISAPYYANSNGNSSAGAVFVLNKLDISYAFSQQNIDDADPQVLLPPFSASTRFLAFGSALAVIDYNADGIADLAVGSTAYGPDPAGSLLGRVDVYLGHQGAGLSSVPGFTLTATQLSEYTDSPFSQQRIGGFLFGEDVNNDGFVDLLIGAPYHSDVPYETHAGRVFGYISGPRAGQGSGQMGPPNFTLVSPQRQPFEWFGFSARAVHLSETNTTLLLVGAPGHAQADPDTGANHTLAGSIYAFSVDAADPKGSPPEFRGLHFAASKGSTQLGSQMHVWQTNGSRLVLFGTPSEYSSGLAQSGLIGPEKPARGWQAGQVRVFDPALWNLADATGVNGKDGNNPVGLLSTLRGTQSPGHFGRALASTGTDLWIGEPFGHTEDGRVHRWRVGLERPECFYAANYMGRARLGHSILVASGSRESELLVVTAPHDSQFSRLSGSVLLLQQR